MIGMNKGVLSDFLRNVRLLSFADILWYYFLKIRRRKSNTQFLEQNPKIKLPPDYLMFESFDLDYNRYYFEGLQVASLLIERLKKHTELTDKSILDWGCGPARVIRHLPQLLDYQCKVFGTDYNEKTIEWCGQNIPDIVFRLNKLSPPLMFPDNSMDVIYGLSVLTHLSEEMHFIWLDELLRVLKKNGILLLTTQGEAFKSKLTEAEKSEFDKGKIVVRGKVKEGHRIFSAFHPKSFMEKLFSKVELLEFIEHISINESRKQDIWILRKY